LDLFSKSVATTKSKRSTEKKTGIELFTFGTPNGWKASIMLEELGIPYSVVSIDITKNIQKEPWFLKINPNGRIPAIIDHDNGDFCVFESGAILIYLAEKYHKFFPIEDAKKKSEVIQWIMFQMGGVGPMQGQANHFYKFAKEKIPYAIERYQNETRRLYTVLDTQLAGKDYLTGELSIADICTFPWVNGYSFAGVSIEGLDNLKRWLDTMNARPAVQKGLKVPAKN